MRERLYAAEPRTLAVEYGETEATAWAGFRTQCRACLRRFAALSRRNLPAEAPSEAEVRAAAVALLTALGCDVGAEVTCSYCASSGATGVDMRSWEIRVSDEQMPVARGGWLAWPGDEEDAG